MIVRSLRSILSGVALVAIFGFALAACGSDGDDGAAEESADETSQDDATESQSTDGSGDGVTAGTSSTVAPQPELAVPALVGANSNDVTVGGFIFEVDGAYLLCETTTDSDPPECDGETIEISNGEVIDPTIFLGDPGSQYSDAEVVVTGDVVDGVLTIG